MINDVQTAHVSNIKRRDKIHFALLETIITRNLSIFLGRRKFLVLETQLVGASMAGGT